MDMILFPFLIVCDVTGSAAIGGRGPPPTMSVPPPGFMNIPPGAGTLPPGLPMTSAPPPGMIPGLPNPLAAGKISILELFEHLFLT